MAGFIFVCSNKTESECFEKKLLGTPLNNLARATKVKANDLGFLLNIQSNVLYGTFVAVTDCTKDIDPTAWGGDFPYQVRIQWETVRKVGNAKARLKEIGVDSYKFLISDGEVRRIDTLLSEQRESAVVDVRTTWPASFRCEDGHYVRSKSEMLIDNWLYHHNLTHAYEKKVPMAQLLSDFYIPKANCYIEYRGSKDAEYVRRKDENRKTYARLGLRLVEMTERDIENLDDALQEKLGALLPKGSLD